MTTAELHARAGASTHLRHVAAGALVAAAGLMVVAIGRTLAAPPPVGVFAVVMVALALANSMPILAPQGASHQATRGHAAPLVPALVLLPWYGVVLAVVGGVATGWLLRRLPGLPVASPARRSSEVMASLGHAALAATAGAAVAALPASDGAPDVVLAMVGVVVFLGVERGLASLASSTVGSQGRDRPRLAVRPLAVTTSMLVLGLLTAVVVADSAAPVVWLALQAAVVTTVALVVSSIDAERVRDAALLRIAAHAHASMDQAAVERAVQDNLTPLVRAARVEIRDLPPAHGDIGTPLPLHSGDPAWLVATHLGRPHGFSERDRRLLASAAPLVATALENARRHTDMTARATVDPLTGVANRRAFEDQTVLRLRHGRITDEATALVVLDLDAFKAVNDEISHQAGDELLVEVARRLNAAVRGGDLVARLGGDEFAVVAALGSVDESEAFRMRLEEHLAGLLAADGRPVSASLGIAVAPTDGRTTRQLYASADARMYADKQARRS